MILDFACAALSSICLAATAATPHAEAVAPSEAAQSEPVEGAVQAAPPQTTEAERAAPVVFSDLDDAAVLQRAVEYIQGIDTLEARFRQFSDNGGLGEGVVKLKRPGLMKFTYDPPTPLEVLANNGLVYVTDKELETTDTYPVRETPLKFLLRRKVDADDLQLVSVDRGADEVTLRLRSSETALEGSIALVFAAPDLELRRWMVLEPDGGSTLVMLADVKEGVSLSNREFRAPEVGGTFLDDR